MRFVADENVSRVVIEVISIADTNSGGPDEAVLAAADAEGCILITEDRDFGELVISQRLGVRGMVLLQLDRLSNAMEADVVADVASAHADKLSGNLIVIEPGRIRIRPLPQTP